MKKVGNKKKSVKKTEVSKGFTLVELLATIAILAIIISVVIFVAIKVIGNSKEKSYQVTVNNIEKRTADYLTENSDELFFIADGNIEYQCIQVKNLVETGYFDNDITESPVSSDDNVKLDDYIYIERSGDSKTVEVTKYVYDESEENKCSDAISALGYINFSLDPEGWGREKKLDINYVLKNVDNDDNYTYSYEFLDTSSVKKDSDNGIITGTNHKEEDIKITELGTVIAYINQDGKDDPLVKKTIDISMIDRTGPVAQLPIQNKQVKASVTIPITVTDTESGLDKGSFDEEDIVVFIANSEVDLTKKLTYLSDKDGVYNYQLLLEDMPYDHTGDLQLKIIDDSIADKVGNLNDEVVFDTDIEIVSEFNINYDANGGSGTMESIICKYGMSCTLSENTFTRVGYKFLGWSTDKDATKATYKDKETFAYNFGNDITLYAIWEAKTFKVNYDANGGSGVISNSSCKYGENCVVTKNVFTRTDYIFLGWSTDKSATAATYQSGETFIYEYTDDITLYAVWKSKTLRIYYNVNGGATTGVYTSIDGGWISKDKSTKFYQAIETGETEDLYNYNNTNYIYIYKNDYAVSSGYEWNTTADGSGTNFSQTTEYKYSTLKKYATDNGDHYQLDLYVDWYSLKNYGYYCFYTKTTLNCRYGMDASYYASKYTFSSGNYYTLEYQGYYNGHYWYHSYYNSCYVAGGDNGRYEWIGYYGESCPSTGGSSSSSGGSSSSSCSLTWYRCYEDANDQSNTTPDYYVCASSRDAACRKQWGISCTSETSCYG